MQREIKRERDIKGIEIKASYVKEEKLKRVKK